MRDLGTASTPSGPRRLARPFRQRPKGSLSGSGNLRLLVASNANDDLGVVKRQAIDAQVKR